MTIGTKPYTAPLLKMMGEKGHRPVFQKPGGK